MADNQHNEIFSDTQCLSLDVMERYAGDQLSAAERQAVEKHLVDCSICSDAMEGLSIAGFSSDIGDRVAHLNERIAASTAKSSGGIWKKEYYSYAAGLAGVLLLSGLLLNYLKTSDINNQNILTDQITPEPPVSKEEVATATTNENEPVGEADKDGGVILETAEISSSTKEAGPEKDAERESSELRSDNNSPNQEPEAGNGNAVVAGVYNSEPPAELIEDAVDDLDLVEEVYNEEKAIHYDMQTGSALSGEEQLAKSTASTGKSAKKNSKDGGDSNSSADKKKESTRTMAQADEYDDPGTLYNAHVPAAATADVESTSYNNIAVLMDSIADTVQAPMFQGGESGLRQYLADNLVYPDSAAKLGIEGRVHVSFNVNADSTISDAAIVKSIGGGCDEEAIRVVNEMPNWTPARKQGEIVSSQQELSIDFHPGTRSDKK